MKVRDANSKDIPAIASIHVKSSSIAYEGILPPMSISARISAWTEILAQRDGSILVSSNEKGVCGFVHFGSSRDADTAGSSTGEIYSIYVAPSEWGGGTGRELYSQAETILTKQGFKELTLWVLAENNRARRFYEKQGYTLDGKEKTTTRGDKILTELRYRKMA